MTKKEHVEGTTRLAIEAFKSHAIVFEDRITGRWRIMRHREDGTRCGMHATEIISLMNGRLFVGGDIDDCVFGYWGAPEGIPEQEYHIRKVAWIGQHTEPDAYVSEKAAIGLTDGRRLTEIWDGDIAAEELEGVIKEFFEGGEDSVTKSVNDHYRSIIREAIQMAKDGDGPHMVRQHLYDDMGDNYETIPSGLGMVTSPRVIYAWAACRKLCELIL